MTLHEIEDGIWADDEGNLFKEVSSWTGSYEIDLDNPDYSNVHYLRQVKTFVPIENPLARTA